MRLLPDFDEKARYWIAVGGAASFSGAVYQVVVTRVSAYLFPIHMLTTLALVLGLSISCTGVGALASRFAPRFVKPMAVVQALAILASTLGLFFWYRVFPFSHGAVASQIVPVAAAVVATTAVPFCLAGYFTGCAYAGCLAADPRSVNHLAAWTGILFFAGYLGSTVLIQVVGLFGVVASAACLSLVPLVGRGRWRYVALAAALVLPIDVTDLVFSRLARDPTFWPFEHAPAEHLKGGWSPYARVDFYDLGKSTTAGVYNGLQQWVVSPRPADNFDVRTLLYPHMQGSVLVIGTGGGQGLQALTPDTDVVAVELDPFVLRTMSGALAPNAAFAYNRPRTTRVAGDGRAFLDGTDRTFDFIVYEGADANISHQQHSLFGMENHLYTREGLAAAFARLKQDGVVAIFSSLEEDELGRVVDGMPAKVASRAWNGTTHGVIDFGFWLVSASRSEETLDAWSRLIGRSGLFPESRDLTRTGSSAAAGRGVPDSRPVLYAAAAGATSFWGPFALAALVATLIAAFLGGRLRLGAYFTSIGMGFVTAELVLLGSLRSLLGGYLETAALALGAVSVFHALGSIAAPRFARPGRALLTALVVVVCLFACRFPPFGAWVGIQVLWLLAICAPMGFSMGVFLPNGIRASDSRKAASWIAVDSLASGLAALAFYAAALEVGTEHLWIAPAALYLVAALLSPRSAAR